MYSGNIYDMVESLTKMFNRFNDVIIYPGHGESANIDEAKKRIRLLLAIKNIKI